MLLQLAGLSVAAPLHGEPFEPVPYDRFEAGGHEYGGVIVPVGFGPTGTFAYVQATTGWGRGPVVALVVVDLRTDAKLGEVEVEGPGPERPLEALWQARGPEADALLAHHGVVPSAGDVVSWPLETAGRSWTVQVSPLPLQPTADCATWRSYTVDLVGADLGSKRVAAPRGCVPAPSPEPREPTRAVGGMVSPLEKRVVIFLAEEPVYALEHDWSVILRVVGADLTSGFPATPK